MEKCLNISSISMGCQFLLPGKVAFQANLERCRGEVNSKTESDSDSWSFPPTGPHMAANSDSETRKNKGSHSWYVHVRIEYEHMCRHVCMWGGSWVYVDMYIPVLVEARHWHWMSFLITSHITYWRSISLESRAHHFCSSSYRLAKGNIHLWPRALELAGTSSSSAWVLGTDLWSSHFLGKHFTHWVTCQAWVHFCLSLLPFSSSPFLLEMSVCLMNPYSQCLAQNPAPSQG